MTERAIEAALAFLEEGDIKKFPVILRVIGEAQPSMATILNFTAHMQQVYQTVGEKRDKLVKAILHYRDKFRESRLKTIDNLEKLIENNDVILTHSFSSTVAEAIKRAHKNGKDVKVICTESRPMNEGILLAKHLADFGIKVTLTTDIGIFELIEKSSKIALGVDAFRKSGIVNKIGSRVIAEFSQKRGIPVFFAGETMRLLPESLDRQFRVRHGEAKELVDHKDLDVFNPYFDLTPYELISGIVSENGLENPAEFYLFHGERVKP